jgi:RNA polymerase sigma-70 factor, ECF subfamily
MSRLPEDPNGPGATPEDFLKQVLPCTGSIPVTKPSAVPWRTPDERTATDPDGYVGPAIKTLALDELYDLYARSLYAYACVLARSRSEAEDILQEVFVRLARRPDRLAGIENPRGYLLGMVRNEALRQRSRWHRWWHGDLAAGQVRFAEAAPGGGSPGSEAEGAVERAMGRLPPLQREVVYLKVWQEMTLAEIGGLLALSPNTVASAYRYGLAKLKGMLDHDR